MATTLEQIDKRPAPEVMESSPGAHYEKLPTAPIGRASKIGSTGWVVLLVVWTLSVAWMGAYWDRGWVAHDDGMLAQSAERVLHGQMPHRDFDEVYTGGLSYLLAGGFRVFGENLLSMRRVLFIFFVLWIPAFYYCASRFAGPLASGLVTFLAVAWSLPIYPASMPSWYNLFFATFGLAALLRYVEEKTRRWLLVAGLCAGCSFLIKIPGLYFLAAGCLFLIFAEQSNASTRVGAATSDRNPSRLYRLGIILFSAVFVASLMILIRRLMDFSEAYFFILPGTALVFVLVRRTAENIGVGDSKRLRRLSRSLVPFLSGAAAPVALFLIPYFVTGSAGSFFRGVFVTPFVRISMANHPPLGFLTILEVVPLLALIGSVALWTGRESPILTGTLSALLAVEFFYSAYNTITYKAAFDVFLVAGPIVVAGGCALVLRRSAANSADATSTEKLYVIVAALAMCSVIQFPYSSATYFCYNAPILFLGILALLASRPRFPRLSVAAIAIFYAAFAMLRVTPGFQLDRMGEAFVPAQRMRSLDLPRSGGLRIRNWEANIYEPLIGFVVQKAVDGPIYAGPDSPEIYFLAGCSNPTRMIFNFLGDRSAETQTVLSAIEAAHLKVVVLNNYPLASGPMPEELRRALVARFPEKQDFGKFEVHWRP